VRTEGVAPAFPSPGEGEDDAYGPRAGLLAPGSSAPDPFPAAQPVARSLAASGICPERPRSQWRGPRGIHTRFPLSTERYLPPRRWRGPEVLVVKEPYLVPF